MSQAASIIIYKEQRNHEINHDWSIPATCSRVLRTHFKTIGSSSMGCVAAVSHVTGNVEWKLLFVTFNGDEASGVHGGGGTTDPNSSDFWKHKEEHLELHSSDVQFQWFFPFIFDSLLSLHSYILDNLSKKKKNQRVLHMNLQWACSQDQRSSFSKSSFLQFSLRWYDSSSNFLLQ